eukprot:TRINITY_DN8285_c0_g1_i2.p1 TRINITY_DN8285_c0_g1~~TRINITY_DN8285_c0_g1_i2.p1  ORF type:complete len:370 (+),score=58.98 TRINITY_DN8285_c0_g1_i2:78-1187(+)
MARWRLKLEDFGRRQEGTTEVSEAWHQPRWASRPLKPGGSLTDRPGSGGSTRCPSSARPATSERGRTPMSLSATPGIDTRASSPYGAVARAEALAGDLAAQAKSMPFETGPGDDEELPVLYSLKHGDTRGGVLVPHYDLWVTLHGGNGRWRQAKARQEWVFQVMEHEALERARKQEADRQRARKLEVERIRRAEEEELRRRVEEAEQERKRRKEEELRLQMQREEEARRRKLEEERLLAAQKPRPCEKCAGSGRCTACQGDGKLNTLFLAPTVGSRPSPIFQGRRPRGCRACGGGGDGALASDFFPGSGKCDTCRGTGLIRPPPGGFRHTKTMDYSRPRSPRSPRDIDPGEASPKPNPSGGTNPAAEVS